MLLEYDGTDYHGWQKQPNGRTVQADLESALAVVTGQPECFVVGSGRTDAGVHARGQVAHFDLEDPIGAESRDLRKLATSLNALTPRALAVRDLVRCGPDFHARYDAYERRYTYQVSTAPVAIERRVRALVHPSTNFSIMNEAAAMLIQRANYSCFCLTKSETQNRICDIKVANWTKGALDGEWQFTIVADRFLHGMVRAIVGTLLEIGQNRRSVSDLARIIDSRDRREAGPAAAARGLVLEEVSYPQ